MLKQHSMRAELSFNSHLYATALQFSIPYCLFSTTFTTSFTI
ncbi:hypothetical protein BUC_5191 [Burkholderia pseudomallei 576]|nr:hypothetical protein BUC_5191 [Burkholderia pseudomallei 576]